MARISVIIPCYNEEKTIHLLLDAINQQTMNREEIEVIIADGLSTDHTRDVIANYAADHPELKIKVVDNPRRNIPSGLNIALAAAEGEYIIRLDAHSVPSLDYFERCVANLQAGLGDNVGGIWLIQPGRDTWVARSIAAAASHPFGVGDALYRYATQPALVDTVPFGSFRRDLFDRIGGFDESLLTNEDYEFNARLRQVGGKVYLDPAIRCAYFARSTIKDLSRQYWRYGFWKWRMLKRYPGTLRWRQALPPLFVLSLLFWILVGLFWHWAWLLLALELIAYLGLLLIGALPIAAREKAGYYLFGIPVAIMTMHLSWGAGFLWSIFRSRV